MEVKLVGFEIKTARGFDFGEFFQELERYEKTLKDHKRRKYLYFSDVKRNMVVGLSLFFVDQNKLLIASKDSDKKEEYDFNVDVESLGEGKEQVEPLFFVVHPESYRGVFFKVSSSGSFEKLKMIMKLTHDSYIRGKKREYKRELTEFGKKSLRNINDKVEAKYGGTFSISPLVTRKDLESVIDELDSIESISVTGVMAAEISGKYGPLQPYARDGRTSINIDKDSNMQLLKKTIKNIFSGKVGKNTQSSLKIIGKSLSGEDLDLRVGDNLDHFGRFEFDDFIDLLPEGLWSSYIDSKAIETMIDVVFADTQKFGNPPVNSNWKIKSAKD